MFCPECGTEVADSAKSCTKCGRSLMRVKTKSGGGANLVKLLLIVLVVILLGSAAFLLYGRLLPSENVDSPGYSPQGRDWVPLVFDEYGIKLEAPGKGWELDFDAGSHIVLQDTTRPGNFEVRVLGAISLNPDSYRIDNKPEIFTITSQESIRLGGWGEEVLYTVADGSEDGALVTKHQIYFRRTFTPVNRTPQTFTYLITLTCGSGVQNQYLPTFQHIIDSIELYNIE